MNFNLFCLISLLLFFPAESQPYSFLQILTEPSSNTKSLDISSDNQIMVSFNYDGVIDNSTYIYVWDKTNYPLHQKITENEI